MTQPVLVRPRKRNPMPDSKPRDLLGVCEHAAEALIALLGRDDSIPSALRRAADTVVNELLNVCKRSSSSAAGAA